MEQQPTSPVPNPNQQPVIIYVNQGPTSRTRAEMPKELPLKSFHRVFGIIQMVIGVVMFMMEVAALCSSAFTTGPGMYCGIFIFISGLLSLLAAKMNSRALIIACMILNIIASVMCSIGLGFASFETAWYNNSYLSRYSPFGKGKAVFMLIFCLLELVMTIIHASLSCRSFCRCCMPGMSTSSGPCSPQVMYQTSPEQGAGYVPQGAVVIPQGTVPQGPACVSQVPPFVYLASQMPQQPQSQFQGPPPAQQSAADVPPSYEHLTKEQLSN